MSELLIRDRQRTRSLNVPLLRRMTRHVLEKELHVHEYEVGIQFVSADEMARVNQQFLQHQGSTDVITFDYNVPNRSERIHGEIFVSVADAVKQAREFDATWQSEITRYIIHGLLHLLGYDDLQPAKRREMKREENRLLRRIEAQFATRKLAHSRERRRLGSHPG